MSKLNEHLKEISGEVTSYDNEQMGVCSKNIIIYGALATGLISVSLLHKNESSHGRAINNAAFILGLGALAIARNQLLSYREHRTNIGLDQE